MRESQKLSFPEFLVDLRGVILSPRSRFQIIHERQALWGALFLLLLPTYFSFAWASGLGIEGMPAPAYSFVLPLLLAAVFSLVKLYPVHLFGRLFQRRREGGPSGTFRELLTVYGYTTIPNVLALILAFTVMLSLSESVGALLRDNRAVAISIAVALGLALFLWHFILVFLALKTVYPLRGVLIVAVFIAGSVIGGGITWALFRPVVDEVKVEAACLEPVLRDSVLRFHSVEPGVPTSETIQMPLDRLRYRFAEPRRFELVAFRCTEDCPGTAAQAEGVETRPPAKKPHSKWLAGRILGLPGEQVTVADGRVTIGDRGWTEPYLAPGYGMTSPFTSRQLGAGEYLVLPDNRNIVGNRLDRWYLSRSRIEGRVLVVKWPIGVLIHRPGVFELPDSP